ncbi:hypothetical protein NC658_21430 [Streptomyces griseoincarnatus]|uniref:Uncharacterized protein n=2 Tax=Streptomyces griseoincarnatus TaxID=29305 RepID=A0ABT0VWQ9_STRGI|nr:hypothetical protein [Streptomyces griseoincarnatus]MCM2515793.1 hypothetical protein [Streptomyces griseoincarnatus]
MNILDMDSSAGEQLLPLAPRLVNGAAKEPIPSDRSESDTTRIILQLKQKHAEADAAGLGSPELDAFQNLIISLVAEADNPKAVIAYVAALLREHTENKTYLPKLILECERLGLALHLTDDPAVDLSEIRTIDGRRTLVASVDGVAVAYDDVHAIGRCITCSVELDDTALLYFPANALLSFRSTQDMTGADVKVCRTCVETSGLPLTAAQRGPEWMLRWGCPPWCINDHAAPCAAEWHSALPAQTKLRGSTIDSSGYSSNGEGLPWLSAQVVMSNDKPQAYGRHTQVWLGYGLHLGELTTADARDALEEMRSFVNRLEHVVKQAEEVGRDDFEGDPEIARLDREAEHRRIQAIRHSPGHAD